ncbi:MAG: FAD-binding oxidoreductase, partial [Candidatus Obscuribacterales bacterium]|nr:FAD-binding oxidoreductase [Candidatus Obscuribacterales bacterium]
MLPIEQSCYWLASRIDYQASSPLDSNISAEAVIVGAGFTGLWTAYFLKELNCDLDVAVIEQGTVGYGASGRNAGMVSNCMDHSHALAIAHFGRKEAEVLLRLGLDNIDELADFALDCDFERTGQLFVALAPEHLENCRHNADLAAELGLSGHRVLSAEEVRHQLNSPLYLGGVFSPGGGIVDPI